jgi:hypothetical protein
MLAHFVTEGGLDISAQRPVRSERILFVALSSAYAVILDRLSPFGILELTPIFQQRFPCR